MKLFIKSGIIRAILKKYILQWWSMLADDVNALLNDKKLLLTEVYFKLQEYFE